MTIRAVATHARATRARLGNLRVDAPDAGDIRAALAIYRAVGCSRLADRQHSRRDAERDRTASRERRATRRDYLGLGVSCRALPTCFAIHATPHPQIRPPRRGHRTPAKCLLAWRRAS